MELQAEAFAHAHELLGEVAEAAQRLWTSALVMKYAPLPRLSLSLSTPVYPSDFVSVCLSVCLSVRLSPSVSPFLFLRLSVFLYVAHGQLSRDTACVCICGWPLCMSECVARFQPGGTAHLQHAHAHEYTRHTHTHTHTHTLG